MQIIFFFNSSHAGGVKHQVNLHIRSFKAFRFFGTYVTVLAHSFWERPISIYISIYLSIFVLITVDICIWIFVLIAADMFLNLCTDCSWYVSESLYWLQLACCCGPASCGLCCSCLPPIRESTGTRTMYTLFLTLGFLLQCLMLVPQAQEFLAENVSGRVVAMHLYII